MGLFKSKRKATKDDDSYNHSVDRETENIVSSPWLRFKLSNSPFPRYRHAASSISSEKNEIFLIGGLKEGSVFGDTWKITPVKSHKDSHNSHGHSGSSRLSGYSASSADDSSFDDKIGYSGSQKNIGYSASSLKDLGSHKDSYSGSRISGYSATPIELANGQTPPARVGHAAVLCGNAFIVYGGDTVDTDIDGFPDNNFYLFNINNNKYTISSHILNKPNGRYGHTLQVVSLSSSSSRLYLFGGQLENEVYNDLFFFELNTFKSSKATWTLVEPLNNFKPPPLTNHSMSVHKSKLLIFGGVYNNEKVSNDLWSYDAGSNKWTQVPTTGASPPPTNEHSSCVANDKLYIYGGNDFSGVIYSSLYVLDLNTFVWSRLIDSNENGSPGPRCGHTMSFIPKYNKIIIMGGDKNDYVSDDVDDFQTYETHLGSENGTMIYQLDISVLENFLSDESESINKNYKRGSGSVKSDSGGANTNSFRNSRSLSATRGNNAEFASANASPVIKPADTPDYRQGVLDNNYSSGNEVGNRKSLDPLFSNGTAADNSDYSNGFAKTVGAAGAAGAAGVTAGLLHQNNAQDEFVDLNQDSSFNSESNTSENQIKFENKNHGYHINNDYSHYDDDDDDDDDHTDELTTSAPGSRARDLRNLLSGRSTGSQPQAATQDILGKAYSSGRGKYLEDNNDSDKEIIPESSKIAPASNGLTRVQTTPESVKQLINELTSELTRLKSTTQSQMQDASERIDRLEADNRQLSEENRQISEENYQLSNKLNDNEVVDLRQQVQERDEIIYSLKSSIDPRELEINEDVPIQTSVPELGKYKLERLELSNQVLYLQQENLSLKQKHDEFEPFMNTQIGGLSKFQQIIQSQEEKITQLTSQLLDQQELIKELNEWKAKHQNLELEFENFKTIHKEDILDDADFADASQDVGDARSILSTSKSKREISSQLETLVSAWQGRQNTGVSRDIGGEAQEQQQHIIEQLQKQVDDLLKICKTNNEQSATEINQLKFDLNERIASLNLIDSKYNDAVQSVNNTSKALKINQEETDAQKSLVEKLIKENNELKMFKKASKRVSSKTSTPTLESGPGTFPPTILEGDVEFEEDVGEINNAHFNMKVKDLEADLYIIKQERDQLKQNVTSLQKQLYLASQDE